MSTYRYGDIVVNNDEHSKYHNQFGKIKSVYEHEVIVEYFNHVDGKKVNVLQNINIISPFGGDHKFVKLNYVPEWYVIPHNFPIQIGSTAFIVDHFGESVYLNRQSMGDCKYITEICYCSVVRDGEST